MSSIYKHRWRLSDKKSPSGRLLFHCPVCGLYDPAPVGEKYEHRECKAKENKDED